MQALLQTAERVDSSVNINNYVFARHLIAYKSIPVDALWGKEVLELGCGNGYGMNMLSPYTKAYHGVDKKIPAISTYHQNSHFVQLNLPYLEQIPDAAYDTIICFQVLEHINKDLLLLQQIRRILKPAGRLFLSTPNLLMSLTRNPFHIREYTPGTIQHLFNKVFSQYTIQGIVGNQTVKAYYARNKAQVEKLTRLDIFNLQYRLPRWMLQFPYSLLNNVSRLLLYKKESELTNSIHYTDFQVAPLNKECLDFFVVATKA